MNTGVDSAGEAGMEMDRPLPIYGKSVSQFGATGDGIADDAACFQAAFDSGEPLIVVPPGTYRIGKPLVIGSDIEVRAHARAEIFLGDGACTKRGDFLLTNRNHGQGDRNITIRGGVWLGNNQHNAKGELYDSNGYSGALICFMNVQNLHLSDMTLMDPAAYFTRFCRLDGFRIENIRLGALHPRPNNDGIHLGGFCRNGIIRSVRAMTPGTPNDDMIALNADDCITRVENLDMACGPISNLLIQDVSAEECHSFVRLLSVRSEISDVLITDIAGGFRAMAVNMDAARYCRTPLVDPASQENTTGVGMVRDVTVCGMRVFCTGKQPGPAYFCLESNMERFEVRDFVRASQQESRAGALLPTIQLRNVRPSVLTYDGLTRGQADQLMHTEVKNGTAKGFRLAGSGVQSNAVQEEYRAQIATRAGGVSALLWGDFSHLTVNGGDE